MEHLTFLLYGPMQSWGEIAVGERRHSYAHPSKSAITGLVAAALGIKRVDETDPSEKKHIGLQNALGFAVGVIKSGSLLRDYHTTQAPPRTGKTRYHTRRDEIVWLSRNELSTVLSYREYRVDVLYRVCLWSMKESFPFSLSHIRDKLLRPEFHLYCGRKACPPAIPLNPRLIQAETLREVFAEPPVLPESLRRTMVSKQEIHVRVYWESHPQSGFEESDYQFTRRDNLLSRRRWQFQDRSEYQSHLTFTSSEEES